MPNSPKPRIRLKLNTIRNNSDDESNHNININVQNQDNPTERTTNSSTESNNVLSQNSRGLEILGNVEKNTAKTNSIISELIRLRQRSSKNTDDVKSKENTHNLKQIQGILITGFQEMLKSNKTTQEMVSGIQKSAQFLVDSSSNKIVEKESETKKSYSKSNTEDKVNGNAWVKEAFNAEDKLEYGQFEKVVVSTLKNIEKLLSSGGSSRKSNKITDDKIGSKGGSRNGFIKNALGAAGGILGLLGIKSILSTIFGGGGIILKALKLFVFPVKLFGKLGFGILQLISKVLGGATTFLLGGGRIATMLGGIISKAGPIAMIVSGLFAGIKSAVDSYKNGEGINGIVSSFLAGITHLFTFGLIDFDDAKFWIFKLVNAFDKWFLDPLKGLVKYATLLFDQFHKKILEFRLLASKLGIGDKQEIQASLDKVNKEIETNKADLKNYNDTKANRDKKRDAEVTVLEKKRDENKKAKEEENKKNEKAAYWTTDEYKKNAAEQLDKNTENQDSSNKNQEINRKILEKRNLSKESMFSTSSNNTIDIDNVAKNSGNITSVINSLKSESGKYSFSVKTNQGSIIQITPIDTANKMEEMKDQLNNGNNTTHNVANTVVAPVTNNVSNNMLPPMFNPVRPEYSYTNMQMIKGVI